MTTNLQLSERIETIPLEDLIPYENNPKEHPEEQVKKIADSILEFGYTVPIIIDGDNRIIAGHGRYRALKDYTDITEVDCIRRDDLNEAQVKAYRIADNRLAESSWDIELLAVEFEELEFEEIDPGLTGFDDDELDDILFNDDGSDKPGVNYTDKIETPVYEPTGRKPDVGELFDTDRYEELLQLIDAADLPDEKRRFLEFAAQRHIVFDYENIAEFYAHEDPEMQELMERLTLVILDYDQAVEQGYVNFVQEALGTEVADAG